MVSKGGGEEKTHLPDKTLDLRGEQHRSCGQAGKDRHLMGAVTSAPSAPQAAPARRCELKSVPRACAALCPAVGRALCREQSPLSPVASTLSRPPPKQRVNTLPEHRK